MSLGSSLQNARKKELEKKRSRRSKRHVSDTKESLKSVIEYNSIEDYLSTSVDVSVCKEFEDLLIVQANDTLKKDKNNTLLLEYESISIPRRPHWTSSTTPEELDDQENAEFIQWRQKIAQLAEKKPSMYITPFEKNLDIWRQLWRVIERSHLIIQVVDARNPLLFHSKDLEEYVTDQKKKSLLLVNKADYLTPDMRKEWSLYFQCKGILFAFFSALKPSEIKRENNSSNSLDRLISQECILSIEELLRLLFLFAILNNETEFKDKPFITVGLAGFPNVGKSSVINCLLRKKKTSVSATPGKTKHFQTLRIPDTKIELCDCPGLVFPTFTLSHADLVINAIIPIDTLRNYIPAVTLILNRIPCETLCKQYGIEKSKANWKNAREFLEIIAVSRGYCSSKGRLIISTSARMILKDYVSGHLLYCQPPKLSTDTI